MKSIRMQIPRILLVASTVLAFAVAGVSTLSAQTDTEKWISTTSGDWSDPANWLNGAIPPTSGANVQFAGVITGAGSATSTIDSSWSANGSVNSMTFFPGSQAAAATGSFILAQGVGVNSLTLGAGGLSIQGGRSGIAMTGPLLLSANQTWSFLSEGTISEANPIVPRLVLSNSLDGVSGGTQLTLRGGDDLNRTPATTVTQGNLHLVEASGAMGSNISRINLHGGTIRLGTNSTDSNFNRLADSTAIASYGGSGLIVFRQGNGTEDMGALHLEKGLFQVRGNPASGSGTSVYRFASLANRAADTTLLLDSGTAGANQINFQFADATGISTGENGIMGGWAIGQTQSAGFRFLAPAANNTTITTVAGTNIADQTALNAVAATDNINLQFNGTLAGNLNLNSLRTEGTRTLDLGTNTLRIGSGGFIAQEASNVTISNGSITAGQTPDTAATLYFHQSPAGSAAATVTLETAPIVDNGSGAVSVVYSGPDWNRSFRLSANNTYTGTTYIQSHVALNMVSGTNYFGADPGFFVADKIQISSGRIEAIRSTTIASNFGIVLSGGGLQVSQISTSLNIDSAISGDGRLLLSEGNLSLGGAASNTYTGPTVVSRIATGFRQSNLILNKTGGATAIAGDLHIISRNMTDNFSPAMVRLDGSNQIADTSLVTIINEGTGTSEVLFRLNGQNDTIRGVAGGQGLSVVEGGQFAASSLTLNPLANDRNEFSGTIRNWATGGGALSITVNGDASGTQVFSGTNTYTGTTNVSAGTLIVNGIHSGTGSATVSFGATLGGIGTLAGATTVDGIIAPGNSIGQFNITNDVTWNGTASNAWKFELGAANSADLLNITGDFLKGGGSDFVFDFANTGQVGTFKLVEWSGTTGFASTDFNYTNLGGSNTGTFAFNGSQLQIVVVPEPSTLVIFTGALLALIVFRRSRRMKA